MSDKPVRAALVGVGAWGRVLANAAAKSDKIDVVCCVGRNPERLAKFSGETGIPARPDIDAVLAEKEIDAVILALPNDLHLPFAEQAARAGKHIYVEKPIANTMADGLRAARLEQTHGIRIVVGHCARLLAGNQLIRRAIDAGELGTVTQIETNFSNDRALRLHPGDWRFYSANSPGGPLSQMAIHQFDTLRFLGGDIEAVSASTARHSPVGAEVEDQWIVAVHFADGKLGTAVSSWTSAGTHNVRVTGTDALMFYDVDQTNWGVPEKLHEHATLYRQARGTGPGARQAIPVPVGNMFRDELELFADFVRHGGSCELSAANGCQALAAVYAALVSAQEGSRIVPLEEIIAAAEAEVDDGRSVKVAAGWRG